MVGWILFALVMGFLIGWWVGIASYVITLAKKYGKDFEDKLRKQKNTEISFDKLMDALKK